jgi:uncharacterized membrane protein YeaQ/YmgE (transglycosylase-associated protein family)
VSNIIWIIVIGFVAGLIARFVSPGPNGPSGFILTTVLGIVGAFVATFIGQLIGWYQLDQGAGLIGATVGAVIVLFIWNRLVVHHVIGDPGAGPQGRAECLNNTMAKASLLIIFDLGAYRSKTWD